MFLELCCRQRCYSLWRGGRPLQFCAQRQSTQDWLKHNIETKNNTHCWCFSEHLVSAEIKPGENVRRWKFKIHSSFCCNCGGLILQVLFIIFVGFDVLWCSSGVVDCLKYQVPDWYVASLLSQLDVSQEDNVVWCRLPPLDKISDRRPGMRKTTKESLDYMPRTVCRLSRNNFLMCLWIIMLCSRKSDNSALWYDVCAFFLLNLFVGSFRSIFAFN